MDYIVTLRGNAREQAGSVVTSLKEVFGDSKARKRFLTSYWGRIPPEVGVSPSRRRRKDREKGAASEAKGEEKRNKKDKKDKKRDKKDKKNRHRSPTTSDVDSDSSPSNRKSRNSPMNGLSQLASQMLKADEEKTDSRMFPALR